MVARIRKQHAPGFGERSRDLRRHARVHRAEKQLRRAARLRILHREIGDALRNAACQVPVHGVAILLPRGAVARAQPLEVEPRVALEKSDEMLAHHSGGAEYAYFDSRLHKSFTIR